MPLPLVDLSEYTPQDDAMLHQQWEDKDVRGVSSARCISDRHPREGRLT
ncbi:hypothetical protein [Nocardia sp. NPDC050413]